MDLRQFILNELGDRVVRVSGEEAWLLCPTPEHADHDPSCSVHLGPTKKPGSWYCFGCGAGGSWESLASMLGLRQINELDLSRAAAGMLSGLLGGFASKSNGSVYYDPPNQQPVTVGWRGFDADFLSRLGCRFAPEPRGWLPTVAYKAPFPEWFLYLFVQSSRGQTMGWIAARLENSANPRGLKYINMPGAWTSSYLYPTPTQMAAVLGEVPDRFAVVEGPRDAMRLVMHGVPAMAILGTSHWSKAKLNELMTFMPSRVVLVGDGDQSGYKLNKRAYDDLQSLIPVKMLSLPPTPEDRPDLDPGNMPESYIRLVKSMLFS